MEDDLKIPMTDEQKKSFNYMSPSEADMTPEWFDTQIVLGLKTCTTVKDVKALLQDVRKHERIIVENELKNRSNDGGLVKRVW